MSQQSGGAQVPLETKYGLLCEYCDFLKDHGEFEPELVCDIII